MSMEAMGRASGPKLARQARRAPLPERPARYRCGGDHRTWPRSKPSGHEHECLVEERSVHRDQRVLVVASDEEHTGEPRFSSSARSASAFTLPSTITARSPTMTNDLSSPVANAKRQDGGGVVRYRAVRLGHGIGASRHRYIEEPRCCLGTRTSRGRRGQDDICSWSMRLPWPTIRRA